MRKITGRIDSVSATILVVVVAATVVQYLSGGPVRSIALDTDALNIPTLVADVLSRHGSLAHWYLSPAPYLFPDALLFVPAHLLAPDAYMRIAVFQVLQLGVLWTAFMWTAARTGHSRPARFASVALALLVYAGLRGIAPYNQLFVAGFHAGGFAISVVLAGLCIAPSRHTSTIRHIAGLGLIAALSFFSTLSDSIVLVQAIAPLSLLLVLLAAGRDGDRRSRIVTAVVLSGAAVLGHALYGSIVAHPTRYPLVLTRVKVHTNLTAVRVLMRDWVSSHRAAPVVIVLFTVAALAMSIRVVRGWQRHGGLDNLVVWFAMAVASSVAGVVLATTNEVTVRYFLPVAVLPIAGLVLVATNSRFLAGRAATALAVAVALVMSVDTVDLARANGVRTTFADAEVACIDDAIASIDGRRGIAQYWDAKYIQNLSRLDITVAQYWDNLTRMEWITSDDYYSSTYDFAIISNGPAAPTVLSVDLIISGNGQPARTVECASHIVLLYGRDKLRIK